LLEFSHFALLGKTKDKIAVIYRPVLKKTRQPDEELFNKLSNEILEMWRTAGRDFAENFARSKFLSFRNEAGSLEYGEVKGKIIFEMRAIKLKFHVTIGKGTEKDFTKLERLKFPDMEILDKEVYINPGKSAPFAND